VLFTFKELNKILIIRFSAIGDVVLTSPVVRCVRNKFPNAIIHFLVKEKFKVAVSGNVHITQCITFKDHPNEVLQELQDHQYDFVIDLQRNNKSMSLRKKLKRPSATFPKLNIRKFLLTTLKINTLPKIHVVDRYFEAVKKTGVVNDNQGLEFFIEKEESLFTKEQVMVLRSNYIALVLGATYFTKRIPLKKLEEIISGIKGSVVLLGGPDEKEMGEQLAKKFTNVINTAGHSSLQQSAHYIKNAATVITSDTGLMHIAAAFDKRIISVWGNTVPSFGMYAYLPKHPENNIVIENNNLRCRPCSKLGHHKCPKGHFKCMLDLDSKHIAELAEQRF
jgi:ADP-heptose:LPS heptosyltransferase